MIETLSKPSSNIGECTYDSETQELVVNFKSGSSYSYRSVPQSVWMGLQNASSLGEYFARQIKNRYIAEQI